MDQRRAAVGEAEVIIEREVGQFMRWLEGRTTVPAIRELHQRGDAFRSVELDRARRRLARGDDPNVVIEALAQGITNKFLHGPTQLLHDAPEDVRAHLLEYLPRLFGAKVGS
jgi:glutamyl-tRNA reductase